MVVKVEVFLNVEHGMGLAGIKLPACGLKGLAELGFRQ